MRVTIIKDDNTVAIDGEVRKVDCSALPVDFHALQWNDEWGGKGEIEHVAHMFANNPQWHKKSNTTIWDFSPYTRYVEAWHAAGQKG